jgi:hypothetical protein
MSQEVCWIDGMATPLGIYMAAYEHCHQPIVLDDVDGLYKNQSGVRLLKALCQTDLEKSLSCLEPLSWSKSRRKFAGFFVKVSSASISGYGKSWSATSSRRRFAAWSAYLPASGNRR